MTVTIVIYTSDASSVVRLWPYYLKVLSLNSFDDNCTMISSTSINKIFPCGVGLAVGLGSWSLLLYRFQVRFPMMPFRWPKSIQSLLWL